MLMKYLGKKQPCLTQKKNYKTIRDVRKENRDEDIILRNLKFLLDSEKDHYKPLKTVNTFNNNCLQYYNMKVLEIKTK